jgi:hypothetical protein
MNVMSVELRGCAWVFLFHEDMGSELGGTAARIGNDGWETHWLMTVDEMNEMVTDMLRSMVGLVYVEVV